MSTRGCVAVGTLREWRGVYNHWGSYPTELGADVWAKLQELGAVHLSEELLKYGDWREFLNEGRCVYCGKTGVGQPHSIVGTVDLWGTGFYPEHLEPGKRLADLDKKCQQNLAEHGAADPEAMYHEHTDPEAPQYITNRRNDPLYIERVPTSWFEALEAFVAQTAGWGPIEGTFLVLQGTADTVVDATHNLRLLGRLLPDLEVVTIPGGRHHLLMDEGPAGEQARAEVRVWLTTGSDRGHLPPTG